MRPPVLFIIRDICREKKNKKLLDASQWSGRELQPRLGRGLPLPHARGEREAL